MRKSRSFLWGGAAEEGSRWVHVVTRAIGRELLFGDEDKEVFKAILFRQLKFSGLKLVAWCFMGDHFHLLLEIPDKEEALAGLEEADFLKRLSVLRGELSTKMALAKIKEYQQAGDAAALEEIVGRVRDRLFDLSAFMKELKLKMNNAYRYAHGFKGTFWAGRFKSVLVEPGEALLVVAAYIDLNPVRAGIVKDPKDYPWCSYGDAMSGNRVARAGLVAAVGNGAKLSWAKAAEKYRALLFGMADGAGRKRKTGYTRDEVAAMLEAGEKLPLTAALRCRVRYFSDGVVMGSQTFVDEFFARQPEEFGGVRTDGGRKMRFADWGNLRVLRALRTDLIGLSDLV